jgi:hypothetical protein
LLINALIVGTNGNVKGKLMNKTNREVFAEELKRNGEVGLSEMVLAGTDNSSGGTAAIAAMERISNELMEALEQSVALQSHYADLLNMHDGGKRIIFKNADEWLERLKATTKD